MKLTDFTSHQKSLSMLSERIISETNTAMFRTVLIQELFGTNEPKSDYLILEAIRDCKLKREMACEKIAELKEKI